MKAETQAILYIAKLVGTALIGSAAAMLVLTYIPLNYIAIGLVTIGLGFMMKTLYEMELTNIKYKEKLNEIAKK